MTPPDERFDENAESREPSAAPGQGGPAEPDAEQAEEQAGSEIGDDLAKAEQDIAVLTSDLQRLQAEYVNYKRRVDRDRDLVQQNPNFHEALMHAHSPDVTTTTCQDVITAGYQIGDRVVRPARVTVVDPEPPAEGQAADGGDE